MRPNQDAVVTSKITAALGELGHRPRNFEIRDHGAHRLYSTAIVVRDDENFSEAAISELLVSYNRLGLVKPIVYRVEEYPADKPNFTRVYITVCI